MGKETLKVGIVGSREYENRQKIKKFIFKLKNEKGVDTIIVVVVVNIMVLIIC